MKLRKEARRYVIIGGEEIVTEAIGVDLAMWVGKTLLGLKINPQETHPQHAAMAHRVLSLLGGGAISVTTRQTSTKAVRTGASIQGDRTRTEEDRNGGQIQ